MIQDITFLGTRTICISKPCQNFFCSVNGLLVAGLALFFKVFFFI